MSSTCLDVLGGVATNSINLNCCQWVKVKIALRWLWQLLSAFFYFKTTIFIETVNRTMETTITSKHKLQVNMTTAFENLSDELY